MKKVCPGKESKLTVSWSTGVLISLANVKKSDATWIMPLDKAEKIRKA